MQNGIPVAFAGESRGGSQGSGRFVVNGALDGVPVNGLAEFEVSLNGYGFDGEEGFLFFLHGFRCCF